MPRSPVKRRRESSLPPRDCSGVQKVGHQRQAPALCCRVSATKMDTVASAANAAARTAGEAPTAFAKRLPVCAGSGLRHRRKTRWHGDRQQNRARDRIGDGVRGGLSCTFGAATDAAWRANRARLVARSDWAGPRCGGVRDIGRDRRNDGSDTGCPPVMSFRLAEDQTLRNRATRPRGGFWCVSAIRSDVAAKGLRGAPGRSTSPDYGDRPRQRRAPARRPPRK